MGVNLDPGASLTMRLSSELLDAHATIRRQRRQIGALVGALLAEQQASASLAELVGALLEAGRDD